VETRRALAGLLRAARALMRLEPRSGDALTLAAIHQWLAEHAG
jgi:hypothetical protein